MTILEAIEAYKAHQALKQYYNFKAFVENLTRDENKPLIESMISGINVIIEGVKEDYIDTYRKLKANLASKKPQEIKAILDSGNKSKIIELLYPIYLDIADRAERNNKTVDSSTLFTKLITSIDSDMSKITAYDPSRGVQFDSYISNLIGANAVKSSKDKVALTPVDTDFHIGAFAQYTDEHEDKISPDGRNAFGRIITEPENGIVTIKWKGISRNQFGKKYVPPYNENVPVDQLEAYDMRPGVSTTSMETPLANSKTPDDSTLQDVIPNTSSDSDAKLADLQTDINEAIFDADLDEVATKYVKARIENAITQQYKSELNNKIRDAKGNMTKGSNVEENSKQIESLTKLRDEIEDTTDGTLQKSLGLNAVKANAIWKAFMTEAMKKPDMKAWAMSAIQAKKASKATAEPVMA